jgi:hypothetical protein
LTRGVNRIRRGKVNSPLRTPVQFWLPPQ